MIKARYKTVRLILGDQLYAGHSWFKRQDDSVLYLLCELKQETDYVKHHVQKICAFFLAMKNFATALKKSGHHIHHMTLDDTARFDSLTHLLESVCNDKKATTLEYQRPDEYRLREQLRTINLSPKIDINERDSEHFLLPFDEIGTYVTPNKHNRMEVFYRKMRKRFDILMDEGKPVGDKWNYDTENRHKLKAQELDSIPEPLVFSNDVSDILDRLEKHKVAYFGSRQSSLVWPTTRAQSLSLLKHFCEHCLPYFGRFQDAMTGETPHRWSLYHSRLSFSINSKMLHPAQVIDAALRAFEKAKGAISLAQIEGFVRQILGWREYIRAVYWVNMPKYAELNALSANRRLPKFFWDGDTQMACMKHAIDQSLEYAYAHHIQRLMVTGNFCLICGIDPKEVDSWYLGIYIDALEWVELPNTRGMSQFADGGFVATKPYCAGGNYINKMSDYCKACKYNVKEKSGDSSCPLNSLYWNFMIEHREKLEKNPRIGMIFRTWEKYSDDVKQSILSRASACLSDLDAL